MAIKSIAKRPWEGISRVYHTWYEPFDEAEEIEKSLWYTLSQDITTAIMPGDIRLWSMVINAANKFHPMDEEEQIEAVSQVAQYQPIVAPVRI